MPKMRHGFTSGQSTSKTAVTIHLNTSKYERNKSIFKFNKATDIVNKLREEDLCCMTVFEGEGTGHYSDNRKEWSSLKHPFSHSKIAKIEMVVPDEKVSKAM